MIEVSLQPSLPPIPAECIVRQRLCKNTEAVEHRRHADDDQAGGEQPSGLALGMDLGVADRADRDDHHVEGVEEVPPVDQCVAGDSDGDHDHEQDGGEAKPEERMLHMHRPKRYPPPPGPSRPGFVILPRSSTLLSCFSATPCVRASWRIERPVRIDSLASLAASSYPITGVSAVASIGLRSTSSGPRSVAWRPSTHRSVKFRAAAARSVIDSRMAAPAAGIITLSSKRLPAWPATATVGSLP